MCTDFPFAVIFTSSVVIMFSSTIYMSCTSKFIMFFDNFDCYGNVCGKRETIVDTMEPVDMISKKFLVHTNFLNPHFSVAICSQRCISYSSPETGIIEYLPVEYNITVCDCRVPDGLKKSRPRLGQTPLCLEPPLEPSEPINGVCIPKRFRLDPVESQGLVGTRVTESTLLKLDEDFEMNWPWLQLLLCPALTFVCSLFNIILVTCAPTYSIPIIFGLTHFGLIGAICLFVTRLVIHNSLDTRLGWWPGQLFYLLERSGQAIFVILLSSSCLAWVALSLITLKLWYPTSRWRTFNLYTAQRLMGLIAKVLRELPGLWLVVPLLQTMCLGAFFILTAGNLFMLLTRVEPVKVETTDCLSFRLSFWVQYVLIPAFLLYTSWMMRLLLAVFQIVPVIFVSSWYHSPAPGAPCPTRSNLSGICQRIGQQAFGSLSLTSLFSVFAWLPLNVLALCKILLARWPVEDSDVPEPHKDQCTRGLWWCIEHRLHQLECGVFTLIIAEQQSFLKAWRSLNRGFCDHLFSTGLVELMRWPELFCTLAKLQSALLGTCFGLLYFPVKPPVVLGFSAIFLGMFFLSYILASTLISNMQHILSTLLIVFAVEEDDIFTRKILNEDVLVGFRHETMKNLFSSSPSTCGTRAFDATKSFLPPTEEEDFFV